MIGKSDDFEVDGGHEEAPAVMAVSETILTFSFCLLIIATFLFLLSGGVVIRGLVLLGGRVILLCLLFDSSVDVSDAKNNKDR